MADTDSFAPVRFSTADLPEQNRVTASREQYSHVALRLHVEPAKNEPIKGKHMIHSAMSTFAHVFLVLRAGGTEPRSNMKLERLATIVRTVSNGISASLRRFMEALRDTRQQQAALELERWRHLNAGDDWKRSFKNDSTTKNRK